MCAYNVRATCACVCDVVFVTFVDGMRGPSSKHKAGSAKTAALRSESGECTRTRTENDYATGRGGAPGVGIRAH